MIEPIDDGFAGGLHIPKVHNPARVFAGFARYVYTQLKGMPVQSSALMICRHVRQEVRSFEVKVFEDFHDVFLCL